MEFAKEIANQDPGLFMATLYDESLFTIITLVGTINVCCDSLFSYDAKVNNINRTDSKKKILEQLYKTSSSIAKEKVINKLMELLWDLH